MLIKKLFVYFIISFFFYSFAKSQEIIIISKVDDEIITNMDVKIEKKYLLLLNKNLNKLSKQEFSELARSSLIREIIKKKEIDKLYIEQDEKIESKIVKDFYNRLGFDNKNKFTDFLDNKNINFEDLKKKLVIEAMWNQIIYNKFKNKVKIDKKFIESEIVNYYNSKKKKYEYNISEILIEDEKDINIKKNEILKYAEKFGFNIAANKYSKSDTSKYGGNIGWVKSSRLSEKIKKEISKINIGEITDPIQSSSGYLLLRLNDRKEIEEKIDLQNELKQQIAFERNKQLKQFSFIYYKKLKKNTVINEAK